MATSCVMVITSSEQKVVSRVRYHLKKKKKKLKHKLTSNKGKDS